MDNIFSVLGEIKRLRIINLLRSKELCVCEIETLLQIPQSTVSRHLNRLKEVGILEGHKDAQWVHYMIAQDFIEKHSLLYDYLTENMINNEVYTRDTMILEKYIQSDYSCENISEINEDFYSVLKVDEC